MLIPSPFTIRAISNSAFFFFLIHYEYTPLETTGHRINWNNAFIAEIIMILDDEVIDKAITGHNFQNMSYSYF